MEEENLFEILRRIALKVELFLTFEHYHPYKYFNLQKLLNELEKRYNIHLAWKRLTKREWKRLGMKKQWSRGEDGKLYYIIVVGRKIIALIFPLEYDKVKDKLKPVDYSNLRIEVSSQYFTF